MQARQADRRRIPTDVICPRGARGGTARIWVPWLVAPLFALAPIAGCALAGKVKQSASGLPTGGGDAVLTAPAVTFGEPPPTPAPAGTAAPVMPVAPAAIR